MTTKTHARSFATQTIALISAVCLALSISGPANSEDTSLAALNDINLDTGLQIGFSEIPADSPAVDPSLLEVCEDVNQSFDRLSLLDGPVPFFRPLVIDDDVTTADLYVAAKRQLDTLLARCAYWDEHASDATGGSYFPSFSDLKRRAEEIKVGSREIVDPEALDGYEPTVEEVLALQEEIQLLIDDLRFSDLPRLNTHFRLSSWSVRTVLDEFSARVSIACPAE